MEQIPPLREMPFKKRIAYLWDYYSKPAFFILLVAAFVIALIVNFVSNRPAVLEIMMVNTHYAETETAQASLDAFLTENGYDSQKDEILLNASFNLTVGDNSANQDQFLLQEMIGVKSYSGFFADQDTFSYFATNGYFQHLGHFLSEEQLVQWSEAIVYGQDPYTQELYPCGLTLTRSNCPWLANTPYETCGFGFLYTDSDPQLCTNFLNYILEWR